MRGPGRPFQPGQSGNPGGRPKSAKALAAKVRLTTEEGLLMVDFHRNRMLDPEEEYANRKASCDWLMTWGFGNPDPVTEEEEAEANARPPLPFGLTSLGPPPEGE